jgi:hypothetical protein
MITISYTTFDPPGSTFPDPISINNSGQIAGYYQDSSGHFDGFLDSHGAYTTINPPGSIDTFVQSINSSGQITGYSACCLFFFVSSRTRKAEFVFAAVSMKSNEAWRMTCWQLFFISKARKQ